MEVLTQTGPALIGRDTLRLYLLELQQEGALIFAPAVLLHPLLDELVEDGGDGLRTDPLQQLEFGPRNMLEKCYGGVFGMLLIMLLVHGFTHSVWLSSCSCSRAS